MPTFISPALRPMPPFRLQPIVDLRNKDVLGRELLAGEIQCPDWSDSDWLDWYAKVPAIIDQHATAESMVFVNVDAHQALHPRVYAGMLSIRQRDHCVIEWTEHCTRCADRIPDVCAAFVALRESGFALAVDDVGDGFDGIGRTMRVLPKFAKLGTDLTWLGRELGPVFLRQVRVLFESLGAQVIAEGIETERDADLARAAGIRYGQGFLFGRGAITRNAYAPNRPIAHAAARETFFA